MGAFDGLQTIPAETPAVPAKSVFDTLEIETAPAEQAEPMKREDRIAALLDDKSFDPVSHAMAVPEEEDIAEEVDWMRKKRSLKPGEYFDLAKTFGIAAVDVVKNFGKGLGTIAGNTIIRADPDAPEGAKERAKTETAAAAQLAEHNAGGFVKKVIGAGGDFVGGLYDKYIAPHTNEEDYDRDMYPERFDESGNLKPEFKDYYEKTTPESIEEGLREYHKSGFRERVTDTKKGKELMSGQVSNEGLIGGVVGLTGTSMTETFRSPQELEEMGAPVDPSNIEAMSTPADPTFLLPLNIPKAATVANKVAGAGLRTVGKGLEITHDIPARMSGRVGRGLRYGAGAAVGLEIVRNPQSIEDAAKVVGAIVALKGAKKLGALLDDAGKELLNPKAVVAADKAAAKAILDGKGGFLDPDVNLANAQRVARKTVQSTVVAPLAMAPLNAAISETPEEFAQLSGGAMGFGALAGATNYNFLKGYKPDYVRAIDTQLREDGAAVRYGNEALDAAHEAALSKAPEWVRDGVNAYRGFFQGLKMPGGKEAEIYVLDGDTFSNEVSKIAGITPEQAAQQRGFYHQGKVFVNASRGAEKVGGTVGHEAGGHAAHTILETLSPHIQTLMRETAGKGLIENGAPTKAFKAFIDAYNKAHGSEALKANDPKAVEEFLAETARQVLEPEGVAKFAAPQGLREKVADNLGDFFRSLLGSKRAFDRAEVPAINDVVRTSLYELGRLRTLSPENGQAPENPVSPAAAPEATPGSPEATPKAPEAGTPKPATPPDPLAPLGIDQAVVDAARDYHIAQMGELKATRSNAKKGVQGESVDKKAERLGAEWDAMFEAYRQHLETTGEKANPATIHQDVIAHALLTDNPAVQSAIPTPEAAPATPEPAPAATPEAATPPATAAAPLASVDVTPSGTAPKPATNATATLEIDPSPVRPESAPASPKPLPSSPETPEAGRVTPAAPSPQEVQRVVSEAETAALASPEHKRARSPERKAEIVKEAKVKALVDSLPKEGDSLAVRTDEFGETTISGKVDPANPVHSEILKLAGLPPDKVAHVTALQSRPGQHVFVDYQSADKPGIETSSGDLDFSGAQRRKEYAESSAQDRAKGAAPAYLQRNKSFIPLRTEVSSKGKVTVLGFSLDKMLSNARSILDAAKTNKIPTGYDKLGALGVDSQIEKDFMAIVENHRNGYKGDGSGPFNRFPDTGGPLPSPDFAPIEIPRDRFNVLNMAMHNEVATRTESKKAATKSKAIEAVNLARINKGFLDPISGEVNPLRFELRKAGFDTGKTLESPLEHLKPELVEAIKDAPEAGTRIVRPSGFDVDPKKMTSKGFPEGKKTASGFMPDVDQTKAAEELKIRYDGEWKGKDGLLHQYTDINPDSASNGTTFYVPHDATPESMRAKVQEKRDQFSKPFDVDAFLKEMGIAGGLKDLDPDPSSIKSKMPEEGGDFMPDTPAFKKWFGKSKVVDDEGNPIVLYRGGPATNWETGEAITSFKSKNGPWAGFFTDSPEVASKFAKLTSQNGAVSPVFVKMEKPFEVDATGKAAGELQFDLREPRQWFQQQNNKEILDAIKSGKYDGIILRNTTDEGTVYVPLDPKQVKSSIGNNGDFDPSNPDTRFMPEDIPSSKVTIGGKEVTTGEPIEFEFLRGNKSATSYMGIPDKESPFDRGFEPSGRYMTEREISIDDVNPKTHETGKISFQNPIVIEAGQYGTPSSWKRVLSEKFGGLTGKKLSQAVIKAGFDGIITVENYRDNPHPGEIVDLTTFDPKKAKYMPDGDPLEESFDSWHRRVYGEDFGALTEDADKRIALYWERYKNLEETPEPDRADPIPIKGPNGEKLSFVQPRRAELAGDQMVLVNVPKFDASYSKDEGFYIAPGGEGAMRGRRTGFERFLEKGEPIETSEVVVDDRGGVSFINGRHRYSVLRDKGAQLLPVSMGPDSVKNARKFGLLEEEAGFMPDEDKNLVTMHNTTAEGVLAISKLDGLPAPSLAVIPKDKPFTGFGDISLVGNRRLIDPEIDYRNEMFEADVYTIRQPRPIHKVDNKAAKALMNGLRKIRPDWYNLTRSESPEDIVNDWLRTGVEGNMLSAISKAERSRLFRIAFTEEKTGKKFTPKEVPRPPHDSFAHSEAIKKLAAENPDWGNLSDAERRALLAPALKQAFNESLEGKPPKIAEHLKDAWEATYFDDEGNLTFHKFDWLSNDVWHLVKGTKEKDSSHVIEEAEAYANAHLEEFKDWVGAKMSPLFTDPTVKVKKKSEPYTLDNIVDAMTRRSTRASEASMTKSLGMARSKSAKQFKTVEELKKYVDQIVEKPEFEAKKKELEEAHSTLSDLLNGAHRWDNMFGLLDDSSMAIGDYLAGKTKGPNGARSALAKNNFNPDKVSDEAVDALLVAAAKMKSMPTEYFEAKLVRPVKLKEFTGAVVPEGTPERVIEILKENGLDVEVYTGGRSDATRLEALRRLTERNPDALFMPDDVGAPETSSIQSKFDPDVAPRQPSAAMVGGLDVDLDEDPRKGKGFRLDIDP